MVKHMQCPGKVNSIKFVNDQTERNSSRVRMEKLNDYRIGY
jgi:hypothetical protein